LKIINDILDFSRLDAGKLSIDPVDFSLRHCVQSAIELLQSTARDKGLTFDVTFATVLPPLLSGDDGRIRQVLINLLGNAVKFTEKGGVTVSVRHHDVDGRILVTIEVTDTGIGIPEDRLDRIFVQFSQADSATTRKFGGTGLGLTISRLLARRMGGDITLTSEPGKGSRFTVTMLLSAATGASAEATAAPPLPEEPLPSGFSVLVAEDNRTNRLLIEKYLKDTALALSFAVDGRQAVETARRERPDVILMDMSMPEMDGLEAARHIPAPPGPQPIIVALTANAFAADREACLAAGMNDFLAKPVRRTQLLATLARHARTNPL
jgi:CheY-like chemotaxis protein/anti-sigma regulatory factor (Ser/Thr protein kinase)